MRKLIVALGQALLLLLALPLAVRAAPCATPDPTEPTEIRFPAGEAATPEELAFARTLPPLIITADLAAVTAPATCEREVINTRFGDFQVTGENGDRYPRRAIGLGPLAGVYFYLVSDGAAKPTYLLVGHNPVNNEIVIRFYSGLPSAAEFKSGLIASTDDTPPLIMVSLDQGLVQYGFAREELIPPPMANSVLADGTTLKRGPQFMGYGDLTLLDLHEAGGVRQKASGVICPGGVEGLPISLMVVESAANGAICSYRVGVDLGYDPNAEIRYRLEISRSDAPLETVFENFRKAGPAGTVLGPSPWPPVGLGVPAEAFSAEIPPDRRYSAWVVKKDGWFILFAGAYARSPDTDAEAAKVAQAILGLNFPPPTSEAP